MISKLQIFMTYHTNSLSPSNVLSATLVEPNGNEQNVTAKYSELGDYLITINATVSGNATINVLLDNTPVGTGAYFLNVIPAEPFAPNSFLFGFSSVSVAGKPGVFFVRLQDIFGNNITANVSDVVSATITPIFQGGNPVSIVAKYDPSLKYFRATYNVTLEGNFTVAVYLNNATIKNNQRMLQVVPNDVFYGTSVLYNVSNKAVAGELQTALLQLKDVFGNNASNANANFTVKASQDSTIVFGTVGNCVRGLCQVTYPHLLSTLNSLHLQLP